MHAVLRDAKDESDVARRLIDESQQSLKGIRLLLSVSPRALGLARTPFARRRGRDDGTT